MTTRRRSRRPGAIVGSPTDKAPPLRDSAAASSCAFTTIECQTLGPQGDVCSVRYAMLFHPPEQNGCHPATWSPLRPCQLAPRRWSGGDTTRWCSAKSPVRFGCGSPRTAKSRRSPAARSSLAPEARAYLPGADWWVAGTAAARAEDADVKLGEVGEVGEVECFYSDRDLWDRVVRGSPSWTGRGHRSVPLRFGSAR